MNKFVNILLLLISFPALAFVVYIGFDFPVEFLKTTGNNIPFKQEIFLGFGAILLTVGGRRSMKRWTGMRMVSQISRFQWNYPMGKSRIRQANMYLNLEAMMHLFLAFATYTITPQAWPISAVYLMLGIDHLIFEIYGTSRNKFRVGITKNAIVVADRDVKIIYFSGLRKVSTQQQSLFFDYIKELQIAIPIDAVAAENRTSFRETIEQIVDRDKVFFSEGFKGF
jgi:hypothetical protein